MGKSKKAKRTGPRILFFDIETAPIIAHVWGLFDQNVGLNQIKADWHALSWAAKWIDEDKVMYADQRKAKNIENDKELLRGIWQLLDEADIIVTQNGKAFDVKKLNARFVIHGFQPPSSFKHIDTLRLARKHFGFTSNKLEYLSHTLNKKYKKLVGNREFDGFNLWKQCLAGNIKAWREMETYNKYDVLSLEELYKRLIPWDSSVNFNLYNDSNDNSCKCGSKSFRKWGFAYTASGKYQRIKCNKCGAETRSNENLFSVEKRKSLTRSAGR
jgi:uncharacterized protein YprB with RNaseH-like and TPR domain